MMSIFLPAFVHDILSFVISLRKEIDAGKTFISDTHFILTRELPLGSLLYIFVMHPVICAARDRKQFAFPAAAVSTDMKISHAVYVRLL